MKKYPNFIIFGFGNYNSLGVLHQLGEANIEGFLLLVGSGKNMWEDNIIRYSRFAKQYIEFETEEAAIEWLIANSEDFEENTILYATSDLAERSIDQNYDRLQPKFIFPNAGYQGAVTRLMDKDVQIPIAEQCGLTVIKGQYTRAKDFDYSKVEFPCMLKPINSTTGSKADMSVCQNLDELKECIANSQYTKDFLVERFLEKDCELLLLGVSFPDGTVWTPALVHKFDVDAIGDYTHTMVYTDVRTHLQELDAVHEFVKKTGYIGPFSVEFGHEKGINYFFEINLRNDGTSHYPLRGGVNLAEAFYKKMRGEEYSPPIPQDVAYLKVNEFKDLKRVLYGKVGLTEWIRQFRSAKAFRYYHKGDNALLVPLIPMFISFMSRTLWRKVCERFAGC